MKLVSIFGAVKAAGLSARQFKGEVHRGKAVVFPVVLTPVAAFLL